MCYGLGDDDGSALDACYPATVDTKPLTCFRCKRSPVVFPSEFCEACKTERAAERTPGRKRSQREQNVIVGLWVLAIISVLVIGLVWAALGTQEANERADADFYRATGRHYITEHD